MIRKSGHRFSEKIMHKCKIRGAPESVQPELAIHRADFRRLDQPRMRDGDRMQRPFELLQPEREKLVEHRKLRTEIVVLPDVSLQKRGMVGHPVENMRRRQSVAFNLPPEVLRNHVCPPIQSDNKCLGTTVPIASSKSE